MNFVNLLFENILNEKEEDIENLKQILLNNFDINKKINNKTALHEAILFGKKKTVQILLENKANPDVTDKISSSPLHYSVMKGDKEYY
jgi:ankyrin repeat protein